MLKCNSCGIELSNDDLFCKKCGTAVSRPSKKLTVWALIISILSLFYSCLMPWSIVVFGLSNHILKDQRFTFGFYQIGILILVPICVAISLICSNASIKRGYISSATKKSKKLCYISIGITILGTILALILIVS